MFCSKCGNQIKDGFKFCPKCGAPVYVKKDTPESEVKKGEIEVEEVSNEIKVSSDNDVVSVNKAEKTKNTKTTESAPKAKKKDVDLTPNEICIPNPMILEELDIEGVMKKAKQGDKAAMLRQAFRYEMGIGTEKDIAKADELYEKVGGRNVLFELEQTHINTILPDYIYDTPIPPASKKENESYFKILPFVKDLLLDYSIKLEIAKAHDDLSEEKANQYKDELNQKLKEVRNLHPELFLAQFEERETEEGINTLLDAIKESTAGRYSLKWIPSLYNFYDEVGKNKLSIPSLFEIKSNGLFIIKYQKEKERINLLNQFVFTLLLQLPIKKILLHFVDLEDKYEYDNLLRQLNPFLYEERPITTDEQFEKLLNHLEERKLDVIKKYGDYSDYCERNKEIPIPYEFIIFFNNTFDRKFEEKLLKLYSSSFRIGAFYVLFEKMNTNHLSFIDGCDILNRKRNEFLSTSNNSHGFILDNGIYYKRSKFLEKKVEYYNLILNYYGKIQFHIFRELLNISYDEAKYIIHNIPCKIKENISLSQATYLKEQLEKEGASCKISKIESVVFNWNDYYSQVDNEENKGYYIEGYGKYEIYLKLLDYHGLKPKLEYELDTLGKIIQEYGIYSKTGKDLIAQFLDSNRYLLLKVFPSNSEATCFVESITRLPKISYDNSHRIRLVPYYLRKQSVDRIGVALYVPHQNLLQENIEKDMEFYLKAFGFSPSICQQIINIISERLDVGELYSDYYPKPEIDKYLADNEFYRFVNGGFDALSPQQSDNYSENNEGPVPNCIGILEEKVGIIKLEEDFDGVLFPDFLNNKYEMDLGFWGFNPSNKNDRAIVRNAINQCNKDIFDIEKNLHHLAIKKWGKNYAKEHLAFIDTIDDVAYLDICETKRYRIPILQSNFVQTDSDIKPVNLADKSIFSQACIKFINAQVDAKEESKIISISIKNEKQSQYESIYNEMLIDVGKAKKNTIQFRMDLVGHVHSFIIGQSGSGKSVFLHNIIGGAMLKYAPEDLQLYLLDFKLGGVEFNRYKGAKHVKALLVDNSNPQVTLEILRELRGSMTERGKLLRSAGVNNIGEYNKIHQQDRMPHVLVVADECHEMFKADDSIPRLVRNEISDIVIKIAKEGRSQGVHLVFATQTLSGTEISSEIINNVSDFYLLKCAQTDSERLVPNSSAITSELSTGQIYYHHVDEQVKFQAYYTDKQTAEKLMAAIVEKAKDHKSNGEFYFNGAQMFYLDEAAKEQMEAVKGKSPVAFMGKAIDISQKDLYIKLNEDFSENVLLLGLNDQEQVTRTTMNLFVSLMMSAKLKHKDIAFKVIDCLNNEEGEIHELIFDLENEGYCDIIERRQRSKFFKELAQGVQDGTAEETILLILGQDRFRELKMDMELEESNSSKSSDDDDMMSISDDFFGDSSSSPSKIRTYREALNVILEKGPDYGVHTLLQIEKASNLLFEDYITPKVVFQKFKHLVMLKSDETAGVTLHLNDDIRLEKLSSDWERLRAYYYAEESDCYTLFTPYMPSKSKDIINLLKSL